MRKRMRLFLWTLLLAAESFSSTAQSLTLFGGKTYIPGSYAGLRYSHYTNSEVNVAGDLFLENAQTAALRYNSFGLNLMGEYLSTRDPGKAILPAGSLLAEPQRLTVNHMYTRIGRLVGGSIMAWLVNYPASFI